MAKKKERKAKKDVTNRDMVKSLRGVDVKLMKKAVDEIKEKAELLIEDFFTELRDKHSPKQTVEEFKKALKLDRNALQGFNIFSYKGEKIGAFQDPFTETDDKTNTVNIKFPRHIFK